MHIYYIHVDLDIKEKDSNMHILQDIDYICSIGWCLLVGLLSSLDAPQFEERPRPAFLAWFHLDVQHVQCDLSLNGWRS